MQSFDISWGGKGDHRNLTLNGNWALFMVEISIFPTFDIASAFPAFDIASAGDSIVSILRHF